MRRARQLAATAWNYARPRIRWRDVIFVALIGLSLLYSVNYYHRSVASQQRQAAAERAAQQRQGAAIEAKLCATLGPLAGLAGLTPPAGNPADNPSRAFEQHLVVKLAPLAQLGPDLGCGKAARP